MQEDNYSKKQVLGNIKVIELVVYKISLKEIYYHSVSLFSKLNLGNTKRSQGQNKCPFQQIILYITLSVSITMLSMADGGLWRKAKNPPYKTADGIAAKWQTYGG